MSAVQEKLENNKLILADTMKWFEDNFNGKKLTKTDICDKSGLSYSMFRKCSGIEILGDYNRRHYDPIRKELFRAKVNQRHVEYRKDPEFVQKEKDFRVAYKPTAKANIASKKDARNAVNREKLMMMPEFKGVEWRDVVGFEGLYKISNNGYIIKLSNYTLSNVRTNKESGYKTVSLCGQNYMHHRIVGFVFIPNPGNKPEINHKNGIRDDNRIENLEWATHQENIQHSFRELNRESNFKGWYEKKKMNTETGQYLLF